MAASKRPTLATGPVKKTAAKKSTAKKSTAKKSTKKSRAKQVAAKPTAKGKTRRTTAARRLSWSGVTKLAMKFPGMEISQSFGTPSLKVKGKFLSRLKEDGETLVLRVSFVVRDHLMRTSPGTYFITDHYRDYPAVLIRIATVDPDVLEQLIEDAWRSKAPDRLVKQFDATTHVSRR